MIIDNIFFGFFYVLDNFFFACLAMGVFFQIFFALFDLNIQK